MIVVVNKLEFEIDKKQYICFKTNMLFKTSNLFFKFLLYYFNIYKNRFLSIKSKDKLFKKVISDLDVYGISTIPSFLNRKNLNTIKKEIQPQIKKLINNMPKKGKYYRNSKMGIYRLYQVSKTSKSAKKIFFNSTFVKNISRYYISNKVEFYQDMAEIRQPLKKKLKEMKSSSDNYHFDDWKIRLKFFLLLSDVGKDDSPMCYLKKSHKLPMINKKIEYYINGKTGNYGFHSSKEISQIKKRYNLKEKICKFKAGTLIIADTRGLHKGTPLKKTNNPRIQLALYSDIRHKKWNPKNINI